MMKISFTTMATPGLTASEQFETAKRYGFNGVDLRIIERGMGEIPKDLSSERAEEFRRQTQGVEAPVLMCYNEKIQAGRDAMEASLLEYMKLAAMLGIPTIRIFTGLLKDQNDLDLLIAVLKTVLEKDKTGTAIAMQNHIHCSVTLKQALAVCRTISEKRIGVILSPDHAVLLGEPYEDMLPELAGYTSQLYVADLTEDHKPVLPGLGKIPYTKILDLLRKNGFDGYVTLKWEKCWHPELPPYEAAFDAFLSWFHSVQE